MGRGAYVTIKYMPFYISDLSILRFWYCCGSWNQSLTDTADTKG